MTTETAVFTGKQALEALQPLGFEVTRETDRIFVARGAMKFTLPKGDEYCSSQLNKIIHDVVSDLRERAINSGRARRDNKIPLMVTYKTEGHDPEVFAVTEDRHTKWQLQSLDDGHRFEALKIHCRPYEPEPLIPAGPKFTVHETPVPAAERAPSPPPAQEIIAIPLSPLLTTGNQTDWASLIRLTNRRVEGIKIEYEQIANKAALLKEQYDAAMVFIRTLGVEAPEIGEAIPGLTEPIAAAPRRTVLAPTTGHSGRVGADNSRWVERLHIAWINAGKPSGYGYMQKIKDKLQSQGEEVPADQVLYRLMKEVYAKATS